jgi:hypothetical protein
MEITGKLIKILPLQSGQGRNGEWRKQEFVIQTDGPYPKSICFTMWGNIIDSVSLVDNSILKVSFDVESREFNERWYTDLKAWRVEVVNRPADTPNDDFIDAQPEAYPDDSSDDLPF